MNAFSVFDASAGAQGVVGEIAGIPVVIDANIPTNLGGGTNESRIFAGRFQDFYLYEGVLRTRALEQQLSGNLQVWLQVYSYLALIADRYPTALSIIGGTGLIPAEGF